MTRNKVLALVPVVGLSFALLTLSASPGHGYVSVSTAAFQPVFDGYDYTNYGYYLTNDNDLGDYFVAPVQLPHGVTVTKLTFYFYDDIAPSSHSYAYLYRADLAGSTDNLAFVQSTSTGNDSAYDDSINYATIDNSQYAYYLWLILDTSDHKAYGVIIEYTYATSLPLVLRSFQSSLGGR